MAWQIEPPRPVAPEVPLLARFTEIFGDRTPVVSVRDILPYLQSTRDGVSEANAVQIFDLIHDIGLHLAKESGPTEKGAMIKAMIAGAKPVDGQPLKIEEVRVSIKIVATQVITVLPRSITPTSGSEEPPGRSPNFRPNSSETPPIKPVSNDSFQIGSEPDFVPVKRPPSFFGDQRLPVPPNFPDLNGARASAAAAAAQTLPEPTSERVECVASSTTVEQGVTQKFHVSFEINRRPLVVELQVGRKPTRHESGLIQQVIEDMFVWYRDVLKACDEQDRDHVIRSFENSKFIELAVNALLQTKDIEKHKINTMWVLILFLFDDLIDRKDATFGKLENKPLLQAFNRLLMSLLKNEKYTFEDFEQELDRSDAHSADERQYDWSTVLTSSELQQAKVLGRAIYDFGCRLRQHQQSTKVDSDLLNAFYDKANQYFQSAVAEMQIREKAPPVEQYLNHRRTSGAVPTVFVLGEFLLNIQIPDKLRQSHLYGIMDTNINTAICLVNDLGGAKEWDSDEPNLLKIRMNSSGVTSYGRRFLEAVHYLADSHDKHMAEFHRSYTELFGDVGHLWDDDFEIRPDELESEKRRAIDALQAKFEQWQCWQGSNVLFTEESSRYRLRSPVVIAD